MEYKLIGIDFDGTLLDDNKKITLKTKKALTNAINKYIIVGVTNRNLNSAKSVADLNLFNYLILNSGSNIYDLRKQECVSIDIINKKEALEITVLLNDFAKQIDFISGTTYYTYKGKRRKDSFSKKIDSIEQMPEDIARISIYLSNNEDANYCYELVNNKYKNINCFIMQDSFSNEKWIIINPKGINKETTLKSLGEKLNISMDEMIFFGDGLNDFEVMKKVGYSIAMGNALDEIKKIANEVTLSNNEDGIAYSIEKLNGN